jgi:hypothetical protein
VIVVGKILLMDGFRPCVLVPSEGVFGRFNLAALRGWFVC